MVLYTIGHSNHPPEKFIRLLKDNKIECVVDVRSKPYSRWVPFANRENLVKLLASVNIEYLYLGNLLGGLVTGVDIKNKAERMEAYEITRQEKPFIKGIDALMHEIKKHRTCIMCAEENPADCHRRLLVGASVIERGVQLLHIRENKLVYRDVEIEKKYV